MGFEIARRNGRYGMRAFCDNCGKEVVDGQCNVLSLRHIEEGGRSFVKIACKVECTRQLDPGKVLANQELGRCVLHLIRNTKTDLDHHRVISEFFD